MIYADYSAGQLSGSALRAAGFSGTVRYAGTVGHTKNTTPGECASIKAAGLDLHAVFEMGTQDYLGGYNAGVTNANALLHDANNCGIPGILFMSADGHLLTGTYSTWQAYLQGARTVLGDRAGAYGFSEAMSIAHNMGFRFLWQAGSDPNFTGTGYVNLWQRNSGQTATSVQGITCDINEVRNPLTPTIPPPMPQEVAVSGIISEFKVDMTKGRAWVSFETDAISAIVKSAWVVVNAAWGNIQGVHLIMTDSAGGDVLDVSGINLMSNKRNVWQAPNGSCRATFEWDPANASTNVEWDGYVAYTTK